MSKLNTFLAGVKVLDLSQYIPGPMASLYLADMGAEVIKVEPPSGDEMRNLGPRGPDGRPIFYEALNAGKTVCRLDLKSSSGYATLIDLLGEADVLIEGFRPGVMARLKFDYQTVRQRNRGLIYCSVSGYGATGSMVGKAAHDNNYLATSGILDRNGVDDPVFFDPPISDTSGALFAALSIVGALHGRRAGGDGCHIDLGLADVTMPLQLLQVAAFGAIRDVPRRRETYLNGGAAYYQAYGTRDGRHVMLGAIEPKFWRTFCDAAGQAHWIARQSEPLPQVTLINDVARYFGGMTSQEAIDRFGAVDCCFSPVLDLEEALTQKAVVERQLVRPGAHGGDLQALFPAYVDGIPPETRPAPRDGAAWEMTEVKSTSKRDAKS